MRQSKRLVVKLLPVVASALLVWAAVGRGQGDQDKIIKSLNFQNAEMRSVFGMLADYAKQNIVIAPTVTGTVTLALSDITWRQAFDIILKTYNLAGVQEEGYIRVLPLRDYLSEQTEIEKARAEQKALVAVQLRVIPVENASAKDMKAAVKAMLSDRGFVDTDERTNSIIVRDIPDNIVKIEEFVKGLDKETKQVKISAQLVEIKSEFLQELGVRWFARDSFFVDAFRTNNIQGHYEFEQRADAKVTDPVDNFTVGAIDRAFNLEAAIRAFAKDNKAKVLAHPEVTTLDNKMAKIQIGSKIPIKQFDASGNVVITFINVGTLLEVTPHVTSGTRILLALKPEQSTFRTEAIGPVIDTKNAETNVVVNNGQTVVIGGLTTSTEEKQTVGLPILKDIPVLGYLFRYTKKRLDTSDLVIFVTPTMVTSETMAPETGMTEPVPSGN